MLSATLPFYFQSVSALLLLCYYQSMLLGDRGFITVSSLPRAILDCAVAENQTCWLWFQPYCGCGPNKTSRTFDFYRAPCHTERPI